MDIQKCILLFLLTFFFFKIDIKILSFIILLYIYFINKDFLQNIINEINFISFLFLNKFLKCNINYFNENIFSE
jgi:hypothetical protein